MRRPTRRPGRRAAALAGAVLAAALAATACGKKAPPRLPDARPAEKAATPRASIREGQLRLEFRVPAHRIFPEREEPWVLARVLRQDPPATDFVEAGAILERDGFAFEAPLSWVEPARPGGSSLYRVEFRDAGRRRRALSEPVTVTWQEPPGAPVSLAARGDDRAVALTWAAPAGAPEGTRYRVYRREVPGGTLELITPEPLGTSGHTDSRITPARSYCYQVRAVSGAPNLEVEGSAAAEACVRTEDTTPPPPPATVQVTALPGAFQLTWGEAAADDVLGYRVYRSIDDGPPELLTAAPVRGNAYRDEAREARAGARYRYHVTAVDSASPGNESPFSPAAEDYAVPSGGQP